MFLDFFLFDSCSLGRLPNLKGQSGHFAEGHCLTSWALPHIQSIHFARMLFNGVISCPPAQLFIIGRMPPTEGGTRSGGGLVPLR